MIYSRNKMIAPKLKKQFSLDGVIMKVIHLPPPTPWAFTLYKAQMGQIENSIIIKST